MCFNRFKGCRIVCLTIHGYTGYVLPPGAAPPVLHPQAGWIPGGQQLPAGKQSPPPKPPNESNSPNRFRLVCIFKM